ncbi:MULTISPECIES: MFS transporter [unclassified Corynebacterium]|uniref:MFS transporter n=1 Tax=unclassified Corynebacterium TaxID=2624378 RepID=UPI001C484230|nr:MULTISPECIES: MFS transporter [unclassified Corynebacterium]MBV7281711.1 MFS transporter [Corynebacterium sp. TAE3-ERU30]MBV7301351.1 MFS transporter [Corynebacterium sp. TAE3-ERU2]
MTPEQRDRWKALAVLMLPVLLVSIDNTVLSFALPNISEQLTPTGTQLLWLVDIYPLVLAGLLIPMGSIGDRVGRRLMLLIGCSGFAVISVVAALAPSAALLVAARAGMGLFGAMIMPATLSLIRNIFSDPTERRLAIAIWAAGFSGGAAIGPVVGGVLLEHFYWGSVFLMAIPVLVPLIVLGPLWIPESRNPHPGALDLLSIVLAFFTMGPIVLAIKSIGASGFSWQPILFAALGLLCGVLFVRRQLGSSNPMLDMRLFGLGQFTGAVLANLFAILSLVGLLYFISQHFQLVSGHSPMVAGLLLVPGMIATIIAGLLVVRAAMRIDAHLLVTFGLLMNAAGYLMVLFSGRSHSDLGLVLAFMVIGIGVGVAETISNDLILSAVPPEKSGAASAISETAYEVGAVLGTAVLGSVVNAVYRSNVDVPDAISGAAAATARDTLGGAIATAESIGGEAGEALAASARAAFDSGVVVTSAIAVVLMGATATMAFFTLRPQR